MQTLTITEEATDAVLDALSIASEISIDKEDQREFWEAYLEIHSQVEDEKEID